MKTHEVAKLTGTTIRTLQYYDKIGLLSPKKDEQNGYREYDHSDLLILQQILFFRELDFSLSDIKEILTNPNYNQQDALQHQKQLLILKRDRFNHLIELVEDTMKGNHMPDFKAFNTNEIDTYAKEVKKRWGSTDTYAEYTEKSKGYNKDTYQALSDGAGAIFQQFANLRSTSPTSPEVQALVQIWQDYITEHFYTCTKEILQGLGLMYVADERFKNNIDQYGEGTASFLAEAIEAYCKQ